jgi:hypothetical protein
MKLFFMVVDIGRDMIMKTKALVMEKYCKNNNFAYDSDVSVNNKLIVSVDVNEIIYIIITYIILLLSFFPLFFYFLFLFFFFFYFVVIFIFIIFFFSNSFLFLVSPQSMAILTV